MAIDLTYLKKRAEMTTDIADEKVRAALSKIVAPRIEVPALPAPEGTDFAAAKLMRNWIDLIPADRRGWMSIRYEDGGCADTEMCLRAAMTAPAYESFRSFVCKDPNENDMEPAHIALWRAFVLKEPVGMDFGNYEMNNIWNALPVDISHKKIKMDAPDFNDFYAMIKCAEWVIENAG
ncbi:MAG: hypothetical protein LBL46_04010 [Rickettsiales bacterium]|jgi:hypothetical protein|nr:hypothetical protein [Rickettsiales bacterium]